MIPPRHPTFSVIIETENLAVEDSEALLTALDSLAAQTLPLDRADDVVLVNSGHIPGSVKTAIRDRYPRMRIYKLDSGRSYYEAKQDPVASTTGDILVFADCDCRYAPEWLESMLAPYTDPSINAEVVTGETSVRITGLQSCFMALAWCFPPHSGSSEPYRTSGYAANNVSFKRTLLERMPLPVHLRLYRGNCSLHARQLGDAGITIWKSPGARACHPTMRPSHAPARFFMWGHHEARVCIEKHRGAAGLTSRISGTIRDIAIIVARRVAMPFLRWPRLVRRHPATLLYTPILLPCIVVADVLFLLGLVATLAYPPISLLGLAKSLETLEHRANG